MSRDVNCPGKHFSELMPEFDVVNLAAGGVGMIDICFQIKSAIDNKADYVIVSKTDSGRTEMIYPLGKDILSPIGIENFRKGSDQRFISHTIPTLMGLNSDQKIELTDEQKLAAQLYFKYMFDKELKGHVDTWAWEYWINQLKENNIRYYIIPNNFCVYNYASKYPYEQCIFHTDDETQRIAAMHLIKEIKNENINT